MIKEKSCKDCENYTINTTLMKDNSLKKTSACKRFRTKNGNCSDLRILKPCMEYSFKYKNVSQNMKWSLGVTAVSLAVAVADLLFFKGFTFGIAGAAIAPFSGLAIGINNGDRKSRNREYGKEWRRRL